MNENQNRKRKNLIILSLAIVVITLILIISHIYEGIDHNNIEPTIKVTYIPGHSNPEEGYVMFEFECEVSFDEQEEGINLEELYISVEGVDNNIITNNYSYQWIHLTSDEQHVKTGDLLIITSQNIDLTGYTIVIEWLYGIGYGEVPS